MHCWFTFGLFSKMRLTVVPSFWAIEVHVSPAMTVYVSRQSWPVMARHSSCQTRQSPARGRRVRVRRAGGRTSPGTRLEQSALITPVFAFWSWNLRGAHGGQSAGRLAVTRARGTDKETCSLPQMPSQVSPATTV